MTRCKINGLKMNFTYGKIIKLKEATHMFFLAIKSYINIDENSLQNKSSMMNQST